MHQQQMQTLRGLGESENDEDLPRLTGGALPLLHNSHHIAMFEQVQMSKYHGNKLMQSTSE